MVTNFDEKGKIFTAVVNKNRSRSSFKPPLNRIEGNIHVRPDERIKDEMDHGETFLAVTDVHIYS